MISAFFKALSQLPDPAFRRVVLKTLLWSILLFAGLVAAAWWLLTSTQLFQWGWLDSIVDWLGGAAAVIAAFVLFPGAALIIISFMLEPVARAVERKHFPDLEPPRNQSVSEAVMIGLRYGAIAIVLNLILLPLYIIPILNIFVFGALNGYLLGREYFELVALRRLDVPSMKAMWRRHRSRWCIAGVLITVMLSIPLVNWFMPVVAVAFMLHMFEGRRRRDG
ncbi:MAG: hypothetical protein HOM58_00690 [Rhodospirillaceae bacterium]|jgi:uncharacterized protein involved in cysteine biosynthesis|nr:hypothetical protein [Rhodospirillaceae bacterium]MBT5459302.1 hypothetical protein [Rhodospirillaceae bacterium]